MDSNKVIHARSVRLVESLGDLANGTIDITEMLSIINEEEIEANLIIDKESFFTATRKLAHQINKKMNTESST